MDLGSLLLGLALLLLVAFIVARPLIEGRRLDEAGPTPADDLLAEREGILAALRDLDFDHAMGKIADEDYAPQRAQFVARGVEALKQLEKLGVEDAIEQAIAARRKARPAQEAEAFDFTSVAHAEAACPNCGRLIHPEDKFCARCGAKLPAAGSAAGSALRQ